MLDFREYFYLYFALIFFSSLLFYFIYLQFRTIRENTQRDGSYFNCVYKIYTNELPEYIIYFRENENPRFLFTHKYFTIENVKFAFSENFFYLYSRLFPRGSFIPNCGMLKYTDIDRFLVEKNDIHLIFKKRFFIFLDIWHPAAFSKDFICINLSFEEMQKIKQILLSKGISENSK